MYDFEICYCPGKKHENSDALYNLAVPQGQARKLHHRWTGPLQMVERIREADY